MVEVGRLPPDDELPVGRNSQRLSKDTAIRARSYLISTQVVVVSEDLIAKRWGVGCNGQTVQSVDVGLVGTEPKHTVRSRKNRVIVRAVDGHCERQRNGRIAVIAVVAAI